MNKNLKTELELLKAELGTPAFEERLEKMNGVYTSDEDKALISEYVLLMLNDIGKELDETNEELNMLETLKSISNMISFKYIAETYFNKSKSWFSQRLNGNMVHGKKCAFNEEELCTLRFALQDISKKIGSLSI
ncbi:DUF5053 domain-containing protein [Bacteroides sp.]|uniref:DUF5053 domain-containing protein n=1 Tax=Bacteroides sp. TaxID=29523 RepID=UPI0023D3DFD5|nr:DUF5053 domain-containing protein [Bacteroides sp.]MDE5711650.1 DUF5053 domain-containing protein [Bacteroides sp.]MDE5759909.1 DUF5053 domain-containing protein [Bacteroides sp.]MDE6216105.1 DUF5053 domain-containing protein [Bacteroides sp.]